MIDPTLSEFLDDAEKWSGRHMESGEGSVFAELSEWDDQQLTVAIRYLSMVRNIVHRNMGQRVTPAE